MTAWFDTWFPAPADWLNRAGNKIGNTASTVIDGGMEAIEIVVAALVLIFLLPVLAHAAMAFAMMLLGAPIWFILALFFIR